MYSGRIVLEPAVVLVCPGIGRGYGMLPPVCRRVSDGITSSGRDVEAYRIGALNEEGEAVDIDYDAVGGRGPFDLHGEVRVCGVCPERVVMPFGWNLPVWNAVIVGVGIQWVGAVVDLVAVREAVAVRVRLARVGVVALDLLPVGEAIVIRVARPVAKVAYVGKLNG